MSPEDLPLSEARVPLWRIWLRIVVALLVTFVFLTSVKILGTGFDMAGSAAVDGLVKTAKNPFVGLFCGILVTSVLQSSSATTTMLVGFVSAGTLDLRTAIPIVMGANIGTTVTNTIVALGHVTRPKEFRRAISCSTMHDFFNMLCVIVLLPLERVTHFLEHGASLLTRLFSGVTLVDEPSSPLKEAMKPFVNAVQKLCETLPGHWPPITMIIIGVVVLFVALYFLTRVLKSLMLGKVEKVLGSYLDRHGPVGILVGAGTTAAVQSSSVTTSFFVPLSAAGILKTRQIYPMVLGANLGTTVTALLGSLAGEPAGMTLAFAHLLFNLTGVLIFYPFKPLRLPIWLSDRFGEIASRHRVLALLYVILMFYGIPLALMFFGGVFSKGGS